MPTPTQTAPDALIEAATRLFGSGGAGAITVARVCREAGAPGDSAVWACPDTSTLLAETWLHATSRFYAVMIGALGKAPDRASAINSAIACVEWLVTNPAEAAVLDAGRTAFTPVSWPAALLERERRTRQAWALALDLATRDVASSLGLLPDEVRFAVEDLPRAVARSYLQSSRPVPFAAIELTGRLAERILTAGR